VYTVVLQKSETNAQRNFRELHSPRLIIANLDHFHTRLHRVLSLLTHNSLTCRRRYSTTYG